MERGREREPTRTSAELGNVRGVPYKFAISRSHPAIYRYGRIRVRWIYSAKVGAEIGSRRNIFLDPLLLAVLLFPPLAAPRIFFFVCARRTDGAREASPCVCVWVGGYVGALRVVDRRTEVLQELLVSGGYAEHSKVPPKITGRFGAPAGEFKRKIRIHQAARNVLR